MSDMVSVFKEHELVEEMVFAKESVLLWMQHLGFEKDEWVREMLRENIDRKLDDYNYCRHSLEMIVFLKEGE